MEKNGMLTEESLSDFGGHKKAEFVDADGPLVADGPNKDKLNRPVKLADALSIDLPTS